MDLTAITFCRDNGIADPRLRSDDAGQHPRALGGERIGTLIS